MNKIVYLTAYTKEFGKKEYTVNEWNSLKYSNSKLTFHRIEGPAIDYFSGYTAYYINGERHRTDGPAVEDRSGFKAYWIKNQRHRIGGPALVWAIGSKFYYNYNKLHRLDGPAIEHHNGEEKYYLDNREFTEAGFNKIINEVRKLTKTERLIDERWWVREFI